MPELLRDPGFRLERQAPAAGRIGDEPLAEGVAYPTPLVAPSVTGRLEVDVGGGIGRICPPAGRLRRRLDGAVDGEPDECLRANGSCSRRASPRAIACASLRTGAPDRAMISRRLPSLLRSPPSLAATPKLTSARANEKTTPWRHGDLQTTCLCLDARGLGSPRRAAYADGSFVVTWRAMARRDGSSYASTRASVTRRRVTRGAEFKSTLHDVPSVPSPRLRHRKRIRRGVERLRVALDDSSRYSIQGQRSAVAARRAYRECPPRRGSSRRGLRCSEPLLLRRRA